MSQVTIEEVFGGLPKTFTSAMNEELVKPFTLLELFKVIENVVGGKTPEYDGIPIVLFKKCWHIVREEIL